MVEQWDIKKILSSHPLRGEIILTNKMIVFPLCAVVH